MSKMKEALIAFLMYVNEECTDRYGTLEIVTSEDEQTKKDYHSQTPEGIVEEYMKSHGL